MIRIAASAARATFRGPAILFSVRASSAISPVRILRRPASSDASGGDRDGKSSRTPSALDRLFPGDYSDDGVVPPPFVTSTDRPVDTDAFEQEKKMMSGEDSGNDSSDSDSSDSDSDSDDEVDEDGAEKDELDWETQMRRDIMAEKSISKSYGAGGALTTPRFKQVDHRGRAAGLGKRKDAVASVFLLPSGVGNITINRRDFVDYFPRDSSRVDMLTPFALTGTCGDFDVVAHVRGGGQSGQAGAVRHGIARALQNWNPEYRPVLRAEGLLSRDPRVVERKKHGRKKARKSFQWVKR